MKFSNLTLQVYRTSLHTLQQDLESQLEEARSEIKKTEERFKRRK